MDQIKIFSPASVANVSCGFDVLGFCLDRIGDEMQVYKIDKPGVEIGEIKGQKLPKDPLKNVASIANWMREIGIKKGDCVATLLPNCPEAIITMLASSSIGAIFTSCSPDFGVEGIIDRFGQSKPKVLISCDGYGYGQSHQTLS